MVEGELAALTAAFLWTISSLFWMRIHMSALGINFIKNALGTLFFLAHLCVFSWWAGQPMFLANGEAWAWLALSGFVGIVIGDTCYFRSLQILGPRIALMLTTTSPLFSMILDGLFLKSQPSTLSILGIVMTVGGIIAVVSDHGNRKVSEVIIPGRFSTGLILAIAAALCQSFGGMFSKQGMRLDTGCSPLEASSIRLMVSAVFTFAMVLGQRRMAFIAKQAWQPEHFRNLWIGTAVGTWLGIWLSQVAFCHSTLPLASTLLTTSPLFALPVLYFYRGERAGLRGIVGAVLGVLGVYLAINF